MPRHYDELFFLPFDHRSSFEKDLFKIFDRQPTSSEAGEISRYKNIIFDGFKQAVKSGVTKAKAGILVDEQFGLKILSEAKNNGFWIACSVEKSGQEEFEFEYGPEFKDHLLKIQPDFVKVLVRFNPQGNNDLNKRQALRLKTLSEFCISNHFYLMLELLVPATKSQILQVGSDINRYDLELRPKLMVSAIEALQAQGIEPDIWKVEGVATLEDSLNLVQQAQKNFRSHVHLIVLGRGKSLAAIKKWLAVAAETPGFIGFAIGRTVWEEALKLHLEKRISTEEASQMIATNFKTFCDLWAQCKQQMKGTDENRHV